MLLTRRLGRAVRRSGIVSWVHRRCKHKLVFCGTPDVAARSLSLLLEDSRHASADWEVVAVVTQPATMMGRGKKRKLTASPVANAATEAGIPVFAPESARDEEFLTILEGIAPDVCVTAAYGQWLPRR